MKRLIYKELKSWTESPIRKPLILRGARQVGKTHLVRQFAREFDDFVEINFEQYPDIKAIFTGNLEPKEIIKNISVIKSCSITPGKTLLFLDEIQACPRAIIALRYFYELMPELHVIAAGSLLDFAIEQVGVPVGRVSFLQMYPMSFIEFLGAQGSDQQVDAILTHSPDQKMPEPIHDILLKKLSEYMMIGGMPKVVATWRDEANYGYCLDILHDIANAYRQDFEKYAKHTQIKFLNLLINQVPTQLSQAFNYSKIDGEYRKRELAPCIELMHKANILHYVYHSSAQGKPLASQISTNRYKIILHDIALTQALLGLSMQDWVLAPAQSFINKGNLTEAFVGQELLVYQNSKLDNKLYYWKRDAKGSIAEIDYIINHVDGIIPVEVKASHGSTLKSMHSFLETHPNSPYGLRFSTHNYSIYEKVHTYPLYAIAKVFNIILSQD